jgi:hypothetical protein
LTSNRREQAGAYHRITWVQIGAFVLSLILLSQSMVTWREMFLFGKIVTIPFWIQSYFPSPMSFAQCVTLICLVPVAFITTPLTRAVFNASLVVALSVVPLLFIYFRENLYGDFARQGLSAGLFINICGQCLYVLLFGCSLPTIVVLVVRSMADWIYKYVADEW